MDNIPQTDREAALQAIASMIDRSEKSQAKTVQGTSQHTLLQNRIKALRIAAALIENSNALNTFTTKDLQNAQAPIASLISKSEKAQTKLTPGTWQHAMLAQNLKALYIATPLFQAALGHEKPDAHT